jgi:predicted kinase
MHTPAAQEDGFYLRYSTITNSLINLPPSFSSTLLANQIVLLSDSGYMETTDKERLMDELTSSVNENDEEKFDDVIEEVTRINKEANTFESFSSIQPSVVIMRGLPGSGKSHLVSHSAEYLSNPSQTAIISADDYFIDDSSRYRFDSSSAHKAHLSCLVKFLTSLANGARLVIIDNTNTQQWEYTIYTYICDILGYQYYILEIPCIGQLMCETYLHRNLHNIQLPAMNKMSQRWEENHRGVAAPPAMAYSCDWQGLSSYSFS